MRGNKGVEWWGIVIDCGRYSPINLFHDVYIKTNHTNPSSCFSISTTQSSAPAVIAILMMFVEG